MITFKYIKNDAVSGLMAAIIALPLAVAFGVSSFSALGPKYIALGAMAGLYGAIFTGIFASLFGGTQTQVTGPTGPMAVVATAAIAQILISPIVTGIADEGARIATIFFLFAAIVILGGAVEIILGLSRAGTLIKYIPYPVIAGFMNGIAIIIFLGQMNPFFGLGNDAGIFSLFDGFTRTNALIATVGAATIISILIIPKISKKIPASLVGLTVGIGAYLIIGKFMEPSFLNLEGNSYIIGNIPSAKPRPGFILDFKNYLPLLNMDLLKMIIGPALTLGVLGAIDTLLTSVVADVKTKTRHNSNKELIGQGIGNAISGIFGGLPGAGATVRTLVNIDAGGKTNMGGIIHGLVLLVTVLLLKDAAKWIPMAVLAGILFVTAVKMIDVWSIKLIRKKSVILDVIIMLIVTIITVVSNLMIAVAIGLVIACVLFIKDQTQKNVVKRFSDLSRVRSNKVRDEHENEILTAEGASAAVIELQGSLFFGTTDSFTEFMNRNVTNAKCVIFDFRHTMSIDLTGAQLLLDIIQKQKQAGTVVCLSGIEKPNDRTRAKLELFLKEIGILDEVGRERVFHMLDFALEYCEEYILSAKGRGMDDEKSCDLGEIQMFSSLEKGEIEQLRTYVKTRDVKKGVEIFKRGDPGTDIFFIRRGEVSVMNKLGESIYKRIITYGRGSHFGEMAVIDSRPRAADVVATSDTELYSLSKNDFYDIMQKYPDIGFKLMSKISIALSTRLRTTSIELEHLEEE